MYADDLKLFRSVKNNVDCCSLQMDVNALLHWCESNGMKVHVKKCKVISFSRSRNPLRFDYTMGDGCPLDRVNSIRDLGVTVDRKMKFNEHIALITGKAFAMLGFLKRNTAHFDDPFALKVLYASLVRSVLEYAAVVWAPYHVTLAARIERVQRAFVRFALRKLPWNNPLILPSYEGRCLLFRLQSLAERRTLMQRLSYSICCAATSTATASATTYASMNRLAKDSEGNAPAVDSETYI
ncbi:uncharacterized protein LOC119766336 [Culex quinquefasciatus]|uniref:uncharacterized protein LOC119766336 n=1 Tax=Culex quinquefasciatus TaxID=7176 RepID=UPI0018E3B36C|nr:uncharacterized protein LOC119766336 [Culex quinquefasciatus]